MHKVVDSYNTATLTMQHVNNKIKITATESEHYLFGRFSVPMLQKKFKQQPLGLKLGRVKLEVFPLCYGACSRD